MKQHITKEQWDEIEEKTKKIISSFPFLHNISNKYIILAKEYAKKAFLTGEVEDLKKAQKFFMKGIDFHKKTKGKN